MTRPGLLLILLLASAPVLLAPPPPWWSDPETQILDPAHPATTDDNYAPANLGQLKHVAKQAKAHLDTNLPGGAGTAVNSLVSSFGTNLTPEQKDSNYAPVNLGQLKAVAKPFYDRLLSFSYDTKANLVARGYPAAWAHDYPWDPATPPAANYAPANLGQLKAVFSFDLSAPPGQLPTWWVSYHFSGQSTIDPNADPDGDGLSNLQEYQSGSNPNSPDTDDDGLDDGSDPKPLSPNVAPDFGTISDITIVAGTTTDVPIAVSDGDGDLSLLRIENSTYALQSDFTALPIGASLYGNSAQLLNGELQLTANSGSQSGTMMVPGPRGASPSFAAKFDLFIGAGDYGADGFVFAYGTLPNGLISESYNASNAISVQFDTYANGFLNGYDDAANTIEVWVGSQRLAKAFVTLQTGTYVPVEILFNGQLLTIRHNGQAIFENLAIPPLTAPAGTTMRFGFGARTGGASERHAIDNLSITGGSGDLIWSESNSGECVFAPAVGSVQRTLRMHINTLGETKITLLARDATGLENRKELHVVVVPPATSAGDSDGDGLIDYEEFTIYETNPNSNDTDGDGLTDGWEVQNGTNPNLIDGSYDPDSDGLTNYQEFQNGTNPFQADTDGDGLPDNVEVMIGSNPTNTDTNQNGMPDGEELDMGGDPIKPGPHPSQPPAVSSNPEPGPDPEPPVPTPVTAGEFDILVRSRRVAFKKHGFPPFQTLAPPKRFLHLDQIDYQTPTPSAPSPPYQFVSLAMAVNPLTGIESRQYSYPNIIPDMICSYPYTDSRSPFRFSRTSTASHDRDPGFSSVVSQENTTQMMVDNGKASLGDFEGDFEAGTPFAYRNVHENELQFDYQKVQFKFKWHDGVTEEQKFPVTYLLLFRPENDPATENIDESENFEVIGEPIVWDGQNEESDETEIDPDSRKPEGVDGSYFLLPVDIKVYRPQEVQEAVTWNLSRKQKIIPDSEIEQKKVGVRINKDGNDGGNENDLIEVEFASAILDGSDLVIKRTSPKLKVFGSKDGTNVILDQNEVVVSDAMRPPRSYWVECTDDMPSGEVEFYIRPKSGGQDTKLKALPFRSFDSVVCALSGEVFFNSASAASQGLYKICEDLYLDGYNIHYFPESSETRCKVELKDQRDKCSIQKIGIWGYSHGGGSTYRLVLALGQINFSGYIDAIKNAYIADIFAENRYPTGSAYHFNYYQKNPPLHGEKTGPPDANEEKDLTSTTNHGSIHADATVATDLKAALKSQITP